MQKKLIGDFIPPKNRLGHFGVYILKHKDKHFTGNLAHVGFQNGIGSTSSFADVQVVLNLINPANNQRLNLVTDITEDYWTAKIEAKQKADEGKTSKTTKKEEEKPKDSEA